MSNEAKLIIAIIGGGIGGLFAALCIHHNCKSSATTIDVYEQAAEYREIGAGIGVGVNGVSLFHKLGLVEQLYAISGNPEGNAPGLVFRRFDNGEELFRSPAPRAGTPSRLSTCSRSALLDLLRKAVEERGAARLHITKVCTKVKDSGEKIIVYFDDKSSIEADLVVACDGIHSTVRTQFVTQRAQYSGQIAYRDIIPISAIPNWPYGSLSTLWVAKHKHFLVYPISQGKELNIVAFANKPETEVDQLRESWTTTCCRADVQNDFADHENTVQTIIGLMRDKPSRWRINDRQPLDTWHFMNGKVILLGDSAHSMVPHLGAGAGQAMEDGWVLGRALADYVRVKESHVPRLSSLEEVASLYQSARLPRAQKAQAASRMVGKTYGCQTDNLIDLTFDECCPVIEDSIGAALKWVWDEDLDSCYDQSKEKVVRITD